VLEAKAAAAEKNDCMKALKEEYRELLEYMEKFPVLRYELLLQFQKFLREQQGQQGPILAKKEEGKKRDRQKAPIKIGRR
jgi:hypothetical protein